jgi:hypothetical protein
MADIFQSKESVVCFNYRLNQIRNRITHSFLNINVEIGYDPKYQHFEIRRKDFIDNLIELFLIVKSAIMYAITAINLTSNYENTVPMNATFQSSIFKSEKLKNI